MATVAELIQQCQTDEAMQKEVADILADGKITMARWSQIFSNERFRRLLAALKKPAHIPENARGKHFPRLQKCLQA